MTALLTAVHLLVLSSKENCPNCIYGIDRQVLKTICKYWSVFGATATEQSRYFNSSYQERRLKPAAKGSGTTRHYLKSRNLHKMLIKCHGTQALSTASSQLLESLTSDGSTRKRKLRSLMKTGYARAQRKQKSL